MLKITCSGSFRTNAGTDQNRCDFTGITGLLPEIVAERLGNLTQEEFYISHAMRMFPIWKKEKENKEFNDKPYAGLIKIYIDNVEVVEGTPACVGKDIKQMEWEELQELACYLRLREIPLYRAGSLRAAREKAYEMYQSHVLKKRIFKTPREIAMFKENIHRRMEDQMFTQQDIEERIEEEMDKAFDMTPDIHNPERGYNFSKLDPIKIKDYNPKKSKKTEEAKIS